MAAGLEHTQFGRRTSAGLVCRCACPSPLPASIHCAASWSESLLNVSLPERVIHAKPTRVIDAWMGMVVTDTRRTGAEALQSPWTEAEASPKAQDWG